MAAAVAVPVAVAVQYNAFEQHAVALFLCAVSPTPEGRVALARVSTLETVRAPAAVQSCGHTALACPATDSLPLEQCMRMRLMVNIR